MPTFLAVGVGFLKIRLTGIENRLNHKQIVGIFWDLGSLI